MISSTRTGRKMRATHHDGELLGNWRIVDGQLVRTLTQPREDLILEANQELRKSPDALRPLSFMGWELSIPELNYYALVKKYPELGVPDHDTRFRAWKKFLGTSEADPYRVRDRRRARAIPSA